MSATYQEYYIQLVNARTKQVIDDDTGVYNVLTAGTPAEATIYSDDKGTSGSNPGTMTDGIIQFWTSSDVTTVDVTILTASGHPVFIAGLTESQHRIEIDVDCLTGLELVLPWTISTSAVSGVNTGFDLNALHVVKDISVKVTTAGGTSNILNVGHSASVSGLFQAAISATGLVQAEYRANTANPVAATITLSLAGFYGVSMLASATDGSNVLPYVPGAVTDITFREANQTGATGAGYIYLTLDKLVV